MHLESSDQKAIIEFGLMADKLGGQKGIWPYGQVYGGRRVEDQGSGRWVTLVGAVWKIRKLRITCANCGDWVSFNVFVDKESNAVPSLCETCKPRNRLTWEEAVQTQSFKTRCANLGITEQEAFERRAKALAVDDLI